MYSNITSGALLGVKAMIINVEVDISPGLPKFTIVGCPGNEVRESAERIWAALKNTSLHPPVARVTINLSPADIHKEGTAYDLPIALGILESSGDIPAGCTKDTLIVGELGLNGEIRPVRGILPIVSTAAGSGIKECIVPRENVREGAVIPGIKIRGASDIQSLVKYLKDPSDEILPTTSIDASKLFSESEDTPGSVPDFSDVSGQEAAKRAAVISAAGFHSMLMTGPPGVGKSLIAKRIPTILPPLSLEESLEVTSIYSVAGKLKGDSPLITKRGFQAPHHTITLPALLGGGMHPKPGAISLAHRSVLFLDEFTEFDKRVIESLRQPLEEHSVNISRANYNVSYPADFLLICAMNPCPCGYYPDRNLCNCSDSMIARYRSKISGPMKDRIDIIVRAEKTDIDKLSSKKSGPTSLELRSMVMNARFMQEERYKNSDISYNSEISVAMIDEYLPLGVPEKEYMKDIYRNMNLTARSYHKILKVARTIADIENSHYIKIPHLAEAVCYRG